MRIAIFGAGGAGRYFGVCLAMLGVSTAAMATDADDWAKWPMGDRFQITLGAYFPRLKTQASVSRTDGMAGTTVNFEQNLGMRDTAALPTFSFDWRFARKHQFGLNYFELNRSGSEVTETAIRIGDKVFSANLPVSSFFDVTIVSASYRYSVKFDAKKEFALGVGLSTQDLTYGIQGNQDGGIISEESGFIAPLPTFDLAGSYAFSEKWLFKGSVGLFAIELDWDDIEDLKGVIIDINASLFYQAFKHIRFGVAYNFFDVDVDWTKRGKFTDIDYRYTGPMLLFSTNF